MTEPANIPKTVLPNLPEALDALIGAFVDAHPQIDRSRIYIGGCSNGGFMTMKQMIFNPSRYAAAYPVCEALADASSLR